VTEDSQISKSPMLHHDQCGEHHGGERGEDHVLLLHSPQQEIHIH